MNRNCNGVYFPDIKKYRCLLNGRVVSNLKMPARCKVCSRDVQATVETNAKMRVVTTNTVVLEIQTKSFGFVPVSIETTKKVVKRNYK
jgi:hypothetical protein